MADRKPCPKLASVTCGLGKGHAGTCAPYPTKPQTIPSLINEVEYARAEITFIPFTEKDNLKPGEWPELMRIIREKIQVQLGTKLLIEGQVKVVVNGVMLT